MSQWQYRKIFKINNYKYRFWILKFIVFLTEKGYSVKLLSSHWATLSHEHFENISNFEDWGLTLVAYKCISVSLKNLHVLLNVFRKMLINYFATHTDNTQIKVIDSSSSRNKLYSTFVVDSKMPYLVHTSDRQKIKSAP